MINDQIGLHSTILYSLLLYIQILKHMDDWVVVLPIVPDFFRGMQVVEEPNIRATPQGLDQPTEDGSRAKMARQEDQMWNHKHLECVGQYNLELMTAGAARILFL